MKKLAEDFRIEFEAVLSLLPGSSTLCDVVKDSVGAGRSIKQDDDSEIKAWHLLVMLVHEAISGHYGPAVPMAVAFSLFRTAAEIFDDIEDADSAASLSAKQGVPIASNAATVLLFLAERAITRLRKKAVNDSTIVHVMNAVNSYYTTACAGQHLDISLDPETEFSEEMYLKVSDMKSASHVECVCHVGALLATNNQNVIDAYTIFGHNLGMASQVANDIQGIIKGTDVLKRKITLPVIYGLAHGNLETRDKLKGIYSKGAEPINKLEETRELLFNCGAIHYSSIQMEMFKERALSCLATAEKSGSNVTRLKTFVR